MKPVLENPTILRVCAPGIALFNVLLSAYFYSNFNNLLTWLPALFAIGTVLLIWREAERLEQADAAKQ